MRTLFRIQCLHCPPSRPPIRTLTTRPRRVPRYTRTWDPTTHKLVSADEPGAEQIAVREALDYASFKATREAQHQAKGLSPDRVIGKQYAMKRLEKCLSLVHNGASDSKLRAQLWRAYALAKAFAPELLEKLPNRAWEVLWTSNSIRVRRNRYCRAHVVELYEDMQSQGIFTTMLQKIEYLESMFFNGKEKEALQKWEEVYRQPPSGRRRDIDPEFFESGVKMHGLTGNAHRAHEVAESLYAYHPSWPPAAKFSVFRALSRSEGSEDHQLMAWKWYVQIKLALGKTASLSDFDTCFVGFLEGRNLSHAKRVFEDMVKAGLVANEYTHEHIHEVLRRLHLLYRLGYNVSSVTGIALHAISVLPKPYHSQVFGDWMKLAVVKKAPEATAQILDMMFNRGTIPETFHFNLLLKALFRTKSKKHELKAENIGWHMVEETTEPFPENLRFLHAGDAIASKQGLDMVKTGGPAQSRKIPSANVATFAILMQYHANHSQWEHVDYLARRMRELDILPNEDVMNVLMDSQCRQGNYNKVWDIYTSLTNVPTGTSGVFPNGATFRCLWKTLRMALGDHSARENNTLPNPRQLLAENLRWWNLVRSRVDAERFRVGLAAQDHGALNSLIMHCFSYVKDLPGSLVAIHALHKQLDLPPSNKAMSILQNHIAWVDMRRESPSLRAQYSRSGVPRQKLEQIGHIYNILQDARFKRMNITGDQWAYMSKEEMAEFSLNILSEFIRVILKRQHSPSDVERMIDEARQEIGLPDLMTGDMDAFNVA